MIFEQHIKTLQNNYKIVGTIDLDQWTTYKYEDAQNWLREQCTPFGKNSFESNERIIFKLLKEDFYVKNQSTGLILRNLQIILNEVGVSNAFVLVLSTNPELEQEIIYVHNLNIDPDNKITGIQTSDNIWNKVILDRSPSTVNEMYQYGSVNPLKMSLDELSEKEKFLLTESKVFCIYPWLHLNVNPDGRAYPCCMTDHKESIGNAKTHTLKQIWNNEETKKLRLDMLSETKIAGCGHCYEKEKSGFFSGRLSANKHHGHHIDKVSETSADGNLNRFEMIYWDIRFSNLCNLKCRSCGHIYSSQWYADQAKLAGGEWSKRNRVLNYAGRTETDMWEQLIPHLDYVEQIYFAGGEPLVMAEHYNILDELERRGRFDVRLIYNTNFTEIKLKDRVVFDYWKKFDSVSIGASLDGMNEYGEYIRKGTDWKTVEQNRQQMLEICPKVDFYVSPTLSIMNALHITDFHRAWVEKGFIQPQDLNVNILLDPSHYRIDIAPLEYKQKIKEKFERHLEWLRPQDRLNRATQGFESAITLLNNNDNTNLLPKFWKVTEQLDAIRKENILDAIPELKEIQ